MENLQTLLSEYHEKASSSTPDQIAAMTQAIKAARAAEQAALAEGAKPCAKCGNMPHVIEQQRGSGNLVLTLYEVGCLFPHDESRQVKRQTREDAVAEWNEKYA